MLPHMKVCGQEFTDNMIQRIQERIKEEPQISRRTLSREICEWWNWKSPNGKWKEMSARVALLRLERRGKLTLPVSHSHPFSPRRTTSDLPLEPSPFFAGSLSDLGKITLLLIISQDKEASRLWNNLLDRYHPLGARPLCGAQIRYLITSSSYGGLAFSAAAWRVKTRDSFIGWDDKTREANLPLVVNNSRFLIRPEVKVKNLASHVLSLAIHRLSADWASRYQITPLLVETFVDSSHYQGTIYRASSWIKVGLTKGRGRQDHLAQYPLSPKYLFLYPLCRNWRSHLCYNDPQESTASSSPPDEKKLSLPMVVSQ